jgi:hypothetical protein
MSSVRLLVGTKKGAFVLTADGKRKDWTALSLDSTASAISPVATHITPSKAKE